MSPPLTLVSIGQVDCPVSTKHMLIVFALRRVTVEQLLLATRHLGLFAVVAKVVAHAVRVVGHVIGAEWLTESRVGSVAIAHALVGLLERRCEWITLKKQTKQVITRPER